ncbi:DNA mismatch repair protein MutS [Formosa sediminum]|uniref:DNA mismatch repair protein MutS n=1 Tax=Formosa sediminum TaxID=2594004 RepID=A0A516GPM5_9FLAO|nr:DNA mismatch repair protein MutS [Formosa sediminum]QDO93449.1 DNA mismatch repair protein MutS [Formosa sediminum]
MKSPITFYKEQAQKHSVKATAFNKQMRLLSVARLVVFLVTVFSIYKTFQNWQIAVAIAVVGISLFLFLLLKYTNIKHQRNLEQAIVAINEDEIKIKEEGFFDRLDGLEFQDSLHDYCLDIDLFGRGSFFQNINRTYINEGTEELAEALKANDINHINKRQQAIQELADKAIWRQHYSAIASLIEVETPAKHINAWLANYKPKFPSILKVLPWVFTGISVVGFALVYVNLISANYLGLWLLIGLVLTGAYLKSINTIASQTEKLKETFKQYSALLDAIENETFQSELLLEKQDRITQDHEKASKIFSDLSKLLDRLDNRNNLISAIFGNGFFLLDIKNTYAIEQWIKTYAHKTTDWFEVISFFDAYNSLGNYTFNNPEFIFPEISTNQDVILAKNLGHPLLKKDKRVDNDLNIKNEEFFIITGANMAGKSTFLRTVSLHIVMANVGLPVCATASVYSPIKLITSMRTSDSLTDDSSYFFSELTRLKYIVDSIQTDRYFIVLDEILKGTNSTDKAIGSRKFVEKLVASHATGIIATHDLSLCEISNELSQVKNHYFDAEIINNELHFDYTFKTGICQNMNASFLLKKMEII